jgi:restriction system protein
MADITAKRKGELLRGLFKVLLPNPEGLQAKSVLQELEKIVPPTGFEAACYPDKPNVRRYEKVVRFSTITTVKAGWLQKDKGLWSLTEEGRAAYQKHSDPEAFFRESSRLYRQWKHEKPEMINEVLEEESVESATSVEEAEESAWAEIEEHLSRMNPYDFQQLVAGLLRGMGYHVVWVAPPGPDKGIDVLAHTDPLGFKDPRIKVQVKRQSDKTSVHGIRSFMAVLGDGDVGLFVCTGGFTKDAQDEARNQERRRLMLIDLRRFFDLWVEHYMNIPEDYRRLLPLKAVHFLAPIE